MEADRTVIQTTVAQPPAPPGIAYMAGEDVLLLAVAMPDMSRAQRRAAVAFAVEDRIARPIDEVHVVLGPALPGEGNARHWLVAVIARTVLEAAPPLRKARLLPDILALPVPEAGQWSVWVGGGRVLVRLPDGAGFAVAAPALPAWHLAAGRPAIVLYGGALDVQFTVLRVAPLPVQPDLSLHRFDLNSGRGVGRGMVMPRAWRQAAAILLTAGLGHMGLLAADIWALGHVKAAAQAGVSDILEGIGQPVGADLEGAISSALARANGTGGPRFIPLMARVFAAIEPRTGEVTVSDLRYTAEPNSLTITLHAPDIATLQDVDGALTRAGFRVAAGAATTGDGLAEQQLTLRAGGT